MLSDLLRAKLLGLLRLRHRAGSRVALGVTVFFGMILATILGLVLTPSLYRMIQGLAERFGGGGVPAVAEGPSDAEAPAAEGDGAAAGE